jgi:hypothetical protein
MNTPKTVMMAIVVAVAIAAVGAAVWRSLPHHVATEEAWKTPIP